MYLKVDISDCLRQLYSHNENVSFPCTDLYFVLKAKNREEAAEKSNRKLEDNTKQRTMRVQVKARSAAVSAVELGHRHHCCRGAAFPKLESRFVFLPTFAAGPPTVTDLRYLDPGCSPVGIDGLTVGAAAASTLVADAPPAAHQLLRP